MSVSALLPTLRVVRRPGIFGPIVSCTGALSGATAEILQRELELLATLEHPALIVDLSRCHFGDVDGMLALLEALQRLGAEGCPLVIVVGTERMARLLRVAGLDQLPHVFPTEEAGEPRFREGEGLPPSRRRGPGPGVRALRLAGPPLVPATWTEARDAMVSSWREIEKALGQSPTEEVLRALTMTTALCERAEAIFRERSRPAAWPCQFCPLFETLGGRPEDVGCRSLLDPIIGAVRAGERIAARTLMDRAIDRLEEMPLPADTHAQRESRPPTGISS